MADAPGPALTAADIRILSGTHWRNRTTGVVAEFIASHDPPPFLIPREHASRDLGAGDFDLFHITTRDALLADWEKVQRRWVPVVAAAAPAPDDSDDCASGRCGVPREDHFPPPAAPAAPADSAPFIASRPEIGLPALAVMARQVKGDYPQLTDADIDSPTPPARWTAGATGRNSRPVSSHRQHRQRGLVIELDCGHTFDVADGVLTDGWAEVSYVCALEHVTVRDRGGPIRELAPRVFEAEEQLGRARRLMTGDSGARLFVDMAELLRERKPVCEEVESARDEFVASSRWRPGAPLPDHPTCGKCWACRVNALLEQRLK